MNEIKFSLIIPHHDIPDLLVRCLESVPVRNDLQVIVIDDASSLENIECLKLIEKKYSYAEFIYLPLGKGGGAARNIGLSKASGDYVLFADADDFFTPCFNQALDDVLKIEADVFFFNAISVDTNDYTFTYRCAQLNCLIKMHNSNPNKAEFELRYAFGEPWSKIIKRSLIKEKNICFEETRIHNDTRFSYLVGHYARKIHIDQRAIYCITDRIGSVSKVLTPERLIIRAKVFAEANKFFAENGVKRFDERAIRPLIKFIMRRDLRNFFICKNALIEIGVKPALIYFKLFVYPYYAIRKFIEKIYQYKVHL